MPKLTKIYTRKGDDGNTSLGNRQRVSKDTLRVRTYGSVDELNAALGLAHAQGLNKDLAKAIRVIQNELFHLGAELAFPAEEGEQAKVPQIRQAHIQALESLIDRLNEDLGPLENFILPGGSPGAATLHLARAICRRAERRLISLARKERVSAEATAYLNRLSDALFVMARYENKQQGVEDPLWDSRV